MLGLGAQGQADLSAMDTRGKEMLGERCIPMLSVYVIWRRGHCGSFRIFASFLLYIVSLNHVSYYLYGCSFIDEARFQYVVDSMRAESLPTGGLVPNEVWKRPLDVERNR